uniref:Uncharacterized protein ORF11 n=1 Tax=Alternaria alternata TaxID=5599 RepID=C9K7E6_ALTAL|nr:hypothetical protein [Alternaria alternata]
MVAAGLVRCNDGNRTPCRLANQKEVCYSNAVLQCFAKLIDPSYLGRKLGIIHLPERGFLDTQLDVTDTSEVDRRVHETDWRHINLVADFVRVVHLMQQEQASVVYPYCFQAILAAKGGENGEQFASGEGAYPYCWFRFTLNSLCEGVGFGGQSGVASHPVIDQMFKVQSACAHVCNACLHRELQAHVPDWGLRLDLNGMPCLTSNQSPATIQELLNAHRKYTETDGERCVQCRENTEENYTWSGFVTAPKILPIEIKTYERELSADKRTRYKFLFSDIVLDRRIYVPNDRRKHTTKHRLQAVVKLEGKGHEHAVAFVRSGKHRWWKCSDEDITSSTWEAVQRTHDDEQVSLVFYRRVQTRV